MLKSAFSALLLVVMVGCSGGFGCAGANQGVDVSAAGTVEPSIVDVSAAGNEEEAKRFPSD